MIRLPRDTIRHERSRGNTYLLGLCPVHCKTECACSELKYRLWSYRSIGFQRRQRSQKQDQFQVCRFHGHIQWDTGSQAGLCRTDNVAIWNHSDTQGTRPSRGTAGMRSARNACQHERRRCAYKFSLPDFLRRSIACVRLGRKYPLCHDDSRRVWGSVFTVEIITVTLSDFKTT